MRWMLTILGIGVVLIGALVAIAVWAYRPAPAAAVAATAPATKPLAKTSDPARPAAEIATPRVQAYSDLLRVLPGMADATISDTKLSLEQVARIHLPYWAYVCPRRDLWISHPDAPTFANAGDDAARGVHLTKEQVVFVHWARTGRQMRPTPVYRDDRGAFRIFRRNAESAKLKRYDYHWPEALSLDDRMIVPTDQGIAVIQVGTEVTEDYRQLTDQQDVMPFVELTPGGFLAWVPSNRPDDESAIAWFCKGAWAQLPPDEWDGPFIHLIPFTDGSVLQIRPGDEATVKLQVANLEAIAPDAAKVKDLVVQLSDDDPEVRDAAHAQLIGMGPATWKLLAQLLPNQQGEARIRLEEITESRTRPMLGRFEIIDSMLRPMWRLRDGVVFLAEAGVKVSSGGRAEPPITPAWISIRRGQPITVLPPGLTRNLAIGSADLFGAAGEWVLSDESTGAQLFFGQELISLTGTKDIHYRRLAGIDRNARVLLAPMDRKPYAGEFLLIDPSVPDTTPLMQIWTMSIDGGSAGWTNDHWPAVKRGQPWVLKGDTWEPLKSELISAAPVPATQPSPSGTLTQLSGSSGGLSVWTNSSLLSLRRPDGSSITQVRPADLPPTDLAGAVVKDRVYLLHPGGKLTRLRISPADAQPLTVDATFADDVPDFTGITRVWIDPAGRLCVTTDDARLIILFIDRAISPTLMDMIPPGELKQARPAQ